MRTQGEARFTGRWQDRSTSTSIVLDSIAKQRALTEDEYVQIFPDLVDRGIIPNSQNKPEYISGFSAIVGITLSLGTLIGAVVYELVRHGH